MNTDDRATPASDEQVQQLEELIRRARARGVRTGVRNDEVQDLDQEQAAELIEQLRRRLGETAG